MSFVGLVFLMTYKKQDSMAWLSLRCTQLSAVWALNVSHQVGGWARPWCFSSPQKVSTEPALAPSFRYPSLCPLALASPAKRLIGSHCQLCWGRTHLISRHTSTLPEQIIEASLTASTEQEPAPEPAFPMPPLNETKDILKYLFLIVTHKRRTDHQVWQQHMSCRCLHSIRCSQHSSVLWGTSSTGKLFLF